MRVSSSSIIGPVCVITVSAAGYLSFATKFGAPGRSASYDFVVVGGGTAALAIAARLAENVSNGVAVIEVGGFYEIDNGNTSTVPHLGQVYDNAAITILHDYPSVDWEFETAPQAGLNNTRQRYWRGKTVGGSSALNNVVYQRGTNGSYQMWTDMVGDQSYTFEALLPYFKKGVQFTPANTALRPENASVPAVSNDAYSSSGGPLQVSYNNYAIPFDSWMKKAFNEVGLHEIQNFVSGKLIGHQYTSQEIDALDETRSPSESAYLHEALTSSSNIIPSLSEYTSKTNHIFFK